MLQVKFARWASALMIFAVLGSVFLAWKTDRAMDRRLERGWFLPPIEFYAAPLTLNRGSSLRLDTLINTLNDLGGKMVSHASVRLKAWDWRYFDGVSCTQSDFEENGVHCLEFATGAQAIVRLRWNDVQGLEAISVDGRKVESFGLPPKLFAQYVGGEPMLRQEVAIGDVPLACLQAATAIEDEHFLTHPGISLVGILRAVIRNVREMRFAQGASTITQQLVKNYFLTDEKTLSRKLREQLMALRLESRFSKDDILAKYLSVIYMGQRGPFQVRGFAAASEFYFGKRLRDLDLSQCALLAAIINSPGRFSPFSRPDAARKRRDLVLAKMKELGMISEAESHGAKNRDLGIAPERAQSEVAPYLTQAILRDLAQRQVPLDEGLRIETTMDLEAQGLARNAVKNLVRNLTQRSPKPGLQASLVVAEPRTGRIVAYVAGDDFKSSQFDRVQLAHRQPGSLVKPLVYLAALESGRSSGEPYSPLTDLDDSPWTYHYDGQSWTPKNYDGQYRGSVPMFFSLCQSLNVPTAKLAVEVGLGNIVDLARRLGITSDLKAVPSLALGALEVHPWEIAQAYQTLSNWGERIELHLASRVLSSQGEELWRYSETPRAVVSPIIVGKLISMMEQTFTVGTARAARALGYKFPGAGKTGTTSDHRDTWFAGFSPELLAVAWVGYDDNTPLPFTGASAALPMWVEFMQNALNQRLGTPRDFAYPEGVDLIDYEPSKVLPKAFQVEEKSINFIRLSR